MKTWLLTVNGKEKISYFYWCENTAENQFLISEYGTKLDENLDEHSF